MRINNPMQPSPEEIKKERQKISLMIEKELASKALDPTLEARIRGLWGAMMQEWVEIEKKQHVPAPAVAMEASYQVLGMLYVWRNTENLSPRQFVDLVDSVITVITRMRASIGKAARDMVKENQAKEGS